MGKPQDLPAGETQMFIAIVINFITYVLALIGFASLGDVALQAAIDIGLSGLCLYLALKFTDGLPRFQQAFGAICGAGAILNFAAIPMLQLTAVPVDQSGISIAFLARFILMVWGFSIVAHILRHTFGIRMATSVGVAVIFYLFMTTVLAVVFPPTAPVEDVPLSRYEPDNRLWTPAVAGSNQALFIGV